jgi:uncharacterized protein YcfJ
METLMRTLNLIAVLPLALLAAACGRNSSPAADDALKTDLALASQASAAQTPISPVEAGYSAQQFAVAAPRPTVTRAVSAPARRTTTARRSTGSSRSSSSGTYYPAPAPAPVIVKHTQRDAAIGAVAGAVIGATTSRSKVKGGIIGAAVGGILGGVIGNNVDKQRQTP